MKTARLTPGIVAAIGITLSLLALGGILYFLVKPTQDRIVVQKARFDANYPDSTPPVQAKARKDLADAKIKVAQTKARWAQTSAAIMPRYDVGAPRFTSLGQLTYELTHYLGPDIERQLRVGGVTSGTKVALPPPPISPNDITNAPVVIQLGSITVNGDFRRILTHFYDWQYFNRLVLVDGLNLTGNSPYMQGTYTATLYIFPQNDDKVVPPIPAAGGGAAAGAAPGPGAFPGGRPGGPPPGAGHGG
jgi:hypothetical protein